MRFTLTTLFLTFSLLHSTYDLLEHAVALFVMLIIDHLFRWLECKLCLSSSRIDLEGLEYVESVNK